MNAKEKLLAFKVELDKELKAYLDQKIEEAVKISPFAKELMEHIADLTLRGGKRIRAALFYHSYLAHGGRDRKEALRVSMSMELSESYLLIHDDIMDNDSLRRGGMTIHTSYRQIGEHHYHDKINTRHFGTSAAMLAGNIANSMSCEIICDSKFKDRNIRRAVAELNRVYVVEQYGQLLDILSQLRDEVKKEDVILIHKLKTVPYSFDGPIKLGAILAGADEGELKKLEGYTTPLGVAFQIQDDILGVFGSEEKLGKPVTSDLKEGKKTLLILDALEKANTHDRDLITGNLGNKRTTMNALRHIREIIIKTGSLANSQKTAYDLVQESIENLRKLRLKDEGKDFLLGIADYMINRQH